MDIVQVVVSISGTVFALVACVLSVIACIRSDRSYNIERGATIKEFYEICDSEEMKRKRKSIYDAASANGADPQGEQLLNKILGDTDFETDVTDMIAFYDTWSLLIEQKYAPIEIFSGSSKYVFEEIYIILYPYIYKRRTIDRHLDYASHCRNILMRLGFDENRWNKRNGGIAEEKKTAV